MPASELNITEHSAREQAPALECETEFRGDPLEAAPGLELRDNEAVCSVKSLVLDPAKAASAELPEHAPCSPGQPVVLALPSGESSEVLSDDVSVSDKAEGGGDAPDGAAVHDLDSPPDDGIENEAEAMSKQNALGQIAPAPIGTANAKLYRAKARDGSADEVVVSVAESPIGRAHSPGQTPAECRGPEIDNGEHKNRQKTDPVEEDEDATEIPCDDTVSIVRGFMRQHEISVLFDGSFQNKTAPTMATNHDEVKAYLSAEDVDALWIIDELLLEVKAAGVKLTKADAERALRKIVRKEQLERRSAVLDPLLAPFQKEDHEKAGAEWDRLAFIFEMDAHMSSSILQHYVWQVKRKALGHPVIHHLMPIVFSQLQGTGKTTFALKFLSPLEELATGPVLLSDFADHRSGDIYRYPAVLVDDVDSLPPSQVPALKSLLTSEHIRRRRLGTSLTSKYRQKATLFGTANNDISDLVFDDTGHRRFAMLPYRNGAPTKGGDPAVWEIVDSIDYLLLWRSVDAFDPSPIVPYINELVLHQKASRPDVLKSWLIGLDLDSEEFGKFQTKHGVPAQTLYKLFCVQTGEATISITHFGNEMLRLMSDSSAPFRRKIRTRDGIVYQRK